MTRRVSIAAVFVCAAATLNAQLPELRAGMARKVSPSAAPALSAVLPGTGQFLQGKDRSIVYAAVEALTWWKFARDRGERTKQTNAFKDLARQVSRARLSPDGPGGDWHYYEMMRDYEESGEYSKSDARLEPETDPTTFNGYTWQVAQATTTNLADALAQYERLAFKPEMRWSWTNAGLQWDLFKRSTEKRNDADAAIKNDLTILALNHLLSMVDAFAEFRLQARPMPDGRTGVGASIRW